MEETVKMSRKRGDRSDSDSNTGTEPGLQPSVRKKARSSDPHQKGIHALMLLPMEMWLKIFEYCVSADGALPFLLRAGCVCRTWRDLSMEPKLWKTVDLKCRQLKRCLPLLEWLAPNRLSACKKVILSGWDSLTDDAVKLIARNCPQLHTVNLSRSRWLSSEGVTELFNYCQMLKNVDLSYSSFSSISTKLCPEYRGPGVLGSSIERLNMKGNIKQHLSVNFEAAMINCPKLKELRIGSEFFPRTILVINPEELQKSCPLLRVLEFDNVSLYLHPFSQRTQALGSGLVHLQVLRCALKLRGFPLFHQYGIIDTILPKLLHNSPQLKVLDVSGCYDLDPSVLLSLPVQALEVLNLSRTKIIGEVLHEIFIKWGHSLKQVAINSTLLGPNALEYAFEVLTDLPACPLRKLSLKYANISLSFVRILTGKLKHLAVLQLQGTNLPAGICCWHKNRYAIKKLHKRICELENLETDKY